MRRALVLTALAFTALGCSACTDPPPPGPVVFGTFNTGLAEGYVAHAADRVPAVAAALAASPTDVLCLQEVWTNQDDDGVWTTENIERLAATFPYSYWQRTADRGPPSGCVDGVEEPMRICVEMHCEDVDVGDLAGCAIGNCGDEFDALPMMCSQCIAANVGNTLDDILAACRGGEGSSLAYDGHNGLLLLSRHPLAATAYHPLTYTVTVRGVLRAEVTPPEAPTYSVYCTHLAADLSRTLAYPAEQSPYESYEEENAGQMRDLMALIDETARHPVVLLADTNFAEGDPDADLRAVMAESHAIAEAGGYVFPYVQRGLPCSFCYGDNPLIDSTASDGKIVDHVMLRERDGLAVRMARRAFDERVPVETRDGVLTLTLSDHFGVEVAIER